MTAGQSVIAPRTAFWVIAVGTVSFACAMLLTIFSDRLGPGTTAGANAYSRSAIGHRALADTLRHLGIPVVVSRHESAARAAGGALLIVAEPDPGQSASGAIDDVLAAADTVLMVLPKWQARRSRTDPRWVEAVSPLPTDTAEGVLRTVLDTGTVVRLPAGPAWQAYGLEGAFAPGVDAQLIHSPALKALVATDGGILVGETRSPSGQRIVVVSDPDILSNHGLGRGDNAAIVVALIEELRPPGGPVIFDEVLHGFQRRPSVWQRLFELPLVVPTGLAVIAIAVLLWSTTGRYGAPAPVQAPLRAGKADLIANAADVLAIGGHGREILQRYFAATIRTVGADLNAPRGLDDRALVRWIDAVGARRGVRHGIAALHRDVDAVSAAARFDPTAALRIASRLHRWKKEMTDGP